MTPEFQTFLDELHDYLVVRLDLDNRRPSQKQRDELAAAAERTLYAFEDLFNQDAPATANCDECQPGDPAHSVDENGKYDRMANELRLAEQIETTQDRIARLNSEIEALKREQLAEDAAALGSVGNSE